MARRRTRSRRRSSSPKKLDEIAVIGYSAVGEPLVDQVFTKFAGNLGMSDDIVKLGAGWFLKKRGGLVGKVGMAMYVIQLYKLGKTVMSGGLGNLFGGSNSNDGW